MRLISYDRFFCLDSGPAKGRNAYGVAIFGSFYGVGTSDQFIDFQWVIYKMCFDELVVPA